MTKTNLEDIPVSKLETIMINGFTPLVYLIKLGRIPFKEIMDWKREDYARLVLFKKQNGGVVPPQIRELYRCTPCGELLLGASRLRDKFLYKG